MLTTSGFIDYIKDFFAAMAIFIVFLEIYNSFINSNDEKKYARFEKKIHKYAGLIALVIVLLIDCVLKPILLNKLENKIEKIVVYVPISKDALYEKVSDSYSLSDFEEALKNLEKEKKIVLEKNELCTTSKLETDKQSFSITIISPYVEK